MNIRQLIDVGLKRLTNRREEMKTKNVSRQRQTTPGSVASVCGACGGEIVEVNAITHRRACINSKCGKEAQ